MKIHRFYFENNLNNYKVGDNIDIANQEQKHQILNVLKLEKGEYISLFNDKRVLLCEIKETENNRKRQKVSLLIKDIKMSDIKIVENEDNRFRKDIEINLYMSVIKKDKFEMIIEKAVELNATSVTPLITMRTEKSNIQSITNDNEKKRISKIIIEATEQCGRMDIMQYHTSQTIDQSISLLTDTNNNVLNLFTHIEASENIREVLYSFKEKQEYIVNDKNVAKSIINIYIGPEGGWHDDEIDKMKQAGYRPVSIARYVLRAETAAIAALSQVGLLAFQDL